MAYITPDTYVKLVRFDVTKEHQLTFSDETTQKNFFDNLQGLVLSNFTYQRKDNVIRYPALYEDIEKYNYCIYCNEAQSNKYYYCYITDMKYINDEMTEITIKTDVFQTWQFDIIYKQMFVEREHVSDDTIGKNTYPEGVETGEYIINDEVKNSTLSDYAFIVQVTKYVDNTDPASYTNYGGIPMVGGAYVFDNFGDLVSIISQYGTSGHAPTDSIFNCYVVPKVLLEYDFDDPAGDNKYHGQINWQTVTETLNKPSSLNGYTPKNNKLFTYPYCYLLTTNNAGNSNIYHYEKFSGSSCVFNYNGIPTIGASVKAVPVNYNNSAINEIEGMNLGTCPTLNWSKENFGDWLVYNSEYAVAKTLTGAGTTALGIMGGVGASAIASVGFGVMAIGGISAIGSAIHEYFVHEKTPDSVKGTTNGDVTVAMGNNTFYHYQMCVKYEYAKKIDDYFSMAGYKVNSIKLPNITGRLNWNFVKTIDCNIEGTEIPEKDIEELKNMFNNGITFWHNYSTFRDYSQSNNIVST